MYCAYCGQRATLQIPSIPDDVCLEHAIEFWAGLLAYARTVDPVTSTELTPIERRLRVAREPRTPGTPCDDGPVA